MVSLFFNTRKKKQVLTPNGFSLIQDSEEILSKPRRKKLISKIKESVGTNEYFWNDYYLDALRRLVVQCQDMPATLYKNHSYRGGLVDFILETICYSIRLREGSENIISEKIESLANYRELITYSIFVSSILESSKNIFINRSIVLYDESSDKEYFANIYKSLIGQSDFFKIVYYDEEVNSTDNLTILTLLNYILSAKGIWWLSENKKLFGWLIQVQQNISNPIGNIVLKALNHSISKNMGLIDNKTKEGVEAKIQMLLPSLIREEISKNYFKYNDIRGDGWLLGDSFYIDTISLNRIILNPNIENSLIIPPEINANDLMVSSGLLFDSREYSSTYTVSTSDGEQVTKEITKMNAERVFENHKNEINFNGEIILGKRINQQKTVIKGKVLKNQTVSHRETFIDWLCVQMKDEKIKPNKSDCLVFVTQKGLAISIMPLLKMYTNMTNDDLPIIRKELFNSGSFVENEKGGLIHQISHKLNHKIDCRVWLFKEDETEQFKSFLGEEKIKIDTNLSIN